MRGFYGFYESGIYELCEQDFRPKEILNTPEETHLETAVVANERKMKISITMTDVDNNGPSNREMFGIVRDYLIKNRITKLQKLAPVYRIYMEYRLEDKNLDTVVDQGICVKDTWATPMEIPLGLTDKNEYVSRIGLSLGTKILKNYQSRVPYGVRMIERNEFYLIITRIYVAQVIMPALSIAPTVGCRPGCLPPLPSHLGIPDSPYNGFKPMPNGKHNQHKHMIYAGAHPSIGQVTELSTLNADAVIIFDSVVAGLQFNPICINFKPDTIEINLRFLFNDILMVGDRSEINAILEENKRIDDTTDEPLIEYPDPIPPCDPNWPPAHMKPGHHHKPPVNGDKNSCGCTCGSKNGNQVIITEISNPLKPTDQKNNTTKWI